MKTRIIVAAIFVPLLFVVLFFLPPVVLAVITALICAIAAYELVRSTKESGIGVYIIVAFAAAFIPIAVWLKLNGVVFMLTLFLMVLILFLLAIVKFKTAQPITLGEIAIALFAGFVVPYFLSTLVSLKMASRLYALLPFIVAFVSDGGAYFTGCFLGKHKATPHISPNKTIEGCVGGLVSAIVVMLLYGLILLLCDIKVNFAIMALYGLLGSFVTQVGDLSFSMIKREFGIKDYGNLLPGHGGMLDRFDSMVFAAPVIYMLVVVLPAF
jgi:phosphatidate cytidylyltransferase